MAISATAVPGLPEIEPGTDLAALVVAAFGARDQPLSGSVSGGEADPLSSAGSASPVLNDGDVLVLAHKAVSKSEGRTRRLTYVVPSARAQELAAQVQKDPRLVQVILDESSEVLRAVPGVLIVLTHHGFVCANAGVDHSNVSGDEHVLLLPVDPDRSARALRARLRELTGVAPGVIVTDSFGRAWRTGQVDIAIGCAGLTPIEDWRGRYDIHGHELHATQIAVADELAAAADLARAKDSAQPAVLIRGAAAHVTSDDGPGIAPLLRARAQDLFR